MRHEVVGGGRFRRVQQVFLQAEPGGDRGRGRAEAGGVRRLVVHEDVDAVGQDAGEVARRQAGAQAGQPGAQQMHREVQGERLGGDAGGHRDGRPRADARRAQPAHTAAGQLQNRTAGNAAPQVFKRRYVRLPVERVDKGLRERACGGLAHFVSAPVGVNG